MSEAIWIAIIAASPLLIANIGKGVSYVIDHIQEKSAKAVHALKKQVESLEARVEEQDKTIAEQAKTIRDQKRKLMECPD